MRERFRADLPAVAHDGPGQRMRARFLRRHGVGEHVLLRHTVLEHGHGNDSRLAFGDRAGLIQQHGVRAAHLLDERAALDEHALTDGRVDRRGERRRRRQLDAAGIIDHQHLQRLLRVFRHQPHRQAQQEVQRHQIVGEFIRIALDGRFFQLARLDHAHDAGDDRLIADLGGLHVNVAVFDDGSGENLVALALFHGHKFARDRALIHHGRAGNHLAVDRDFLARMHRHGVSRADLVDGTALQLSVRHYLPGLAFVGRKHFLNRRARALDGVRGHQLRQIGQRQNHQRRVRVAQHQARDDGSHRQEIRVGAHIAPQALPRAFRHRRGQAEAG